MRSILRNSYRSTERFFIKRANIGAFRFVATQMAARDLRREAAAVVWGQYFSLHGDDRAELTAIRRDVHRIEKGLVMRPRRVPFGKDYVPALVESIARQIDRDALPPEDLAWANDVLSCYFDVTSEVSDDWVAAARTGFKALRINALGQGLVPAPRSQAPESDVSIDALEYLAIRRRSVRWFKPDPVDREAVDRALRVAGQSPSACNRQNIRFHLLFGPEHTEPVLQTVGGTRGFASQVPAAAVVIGRLAGYRHTFDRHAIYVDGGLASMSFLFALETLGLSSCCINWPDVASRYDAIRKHVALAPDEQVVMLIAFGHADPDGLVPSSHKRGIAYLRTRA
ncbi:nitroreductase family protein [Mycolicibacterium mengxianglii]|uniref:nitroreductase family protein n=1 Tax=Mycolicibacterium mengxianglii TaxID=2736649 RepID=UPI0018EEF983|nr:nitroreductase family protein [Mycolicibacterium mengxianglii]